MKRILDATGLKMEATNGFFHGDCVLYSKDDFEGVKILRDNGRVLIIPERGGETVRILAESNSMEAAQELCADVEDIINSVSDKV